MTAFADYAGMGQLLLGVAAVLALVLQQFSTKRKLVKVERAVNGRTGDSTVSTDVAETRTIALDAKDTLALLVQHMKEQDKAIIALGEQLEEVKWKLNQFESSEPSTEP